jgi:DNA-binding protein H-NS
MPTLEKIQAQMKKLQEQADTLIAKKAQAALDQIRELMIKHGLTTTDIEARAKARRERKRAADAQTAVTSKAPKKTVAAKGKLPAKYMNPETGETWSGHARPPAWIRDAADRSRFLIAGASASNGAAAKKAAAVPKKASAKKAVAKKASAKTGATASKKAPAKSAATAKKAAVKKVAVKKTAVKKAVAGKKTAAPADKKPAAKKTPGRRAAAVPSSEGRSSADSTPAAAPSGE